jgi:hypothetical protein
VLKKAYQNLIGDSRSINECLIRPTDWLIDYSSIKFLWDSAILQITAEFFLINLQKPVKLLNFADLMEKFCGNLQKLQICRTSQKCAKKCKKNAENCEFCSSPQICTLKNSPMKRQSKLEEKCTEKPEKKGDVFILNTKGLYNKSGRSKKSLGKRRANNVKQDDNLGQDKNNNSEKWNENKTGINFHIIY